MAVARRSSVCVDGRARPLSSLAITDWVVSMLGELLLSEARGCAGFDYRSGNGELRREFLVGLTIFLLLHPLFMKGLHFGHRAISFARFKANSISGLGVFCVFLMNTRTTTTRRPTAVT